MSNTKELYNQYRAAARAHDDAGAHRILKQICAADPADQGAAAQLRETGRRLAQNFAPELERLAAENDAATLRSRMEQLHEWADADFLKTLPGYSQAAAFLNGKGKRNGAPGMENRARTAQLYKQYREAGLAHDDDKAFAILQQITELDAADQSAQQQKKDTGRRLCARHMRELGDALRNGDMPRLTALVKNYRQWGDATYLSTLQDYPAAARLVDAAAQKEALQTINGIMYALQSGQVQSLQERNEKASEIEQLAVQHDITLDDEKSGVIRKAHEAWQAELHRRSQVDKATNGAARLQTVADDYNLHRPLKENALKEHLQTIDSLETEALLLCDVKEGQEHFDNVQAWKKKLSGDVGSIRRRRTIARRVSSITTLILLALGGTAFYAHSQADNMADQMSKARLAKDVTAVQDMVESNGVLRYFCRLFSGWYRVEYKDSVEWLKQLDSMRKRENELLAQVKERLGRTTLETLEADARLALSCAKLCDELKERFNVDIPQSHRQVIDSIGTQLGNHRDAALSLYTAPPHDADMEALAKLFKHYQATRDIFQFSKEETQSILLAIWNKARNVLLKDGRVMTEAEIEASLNKYNQYVATMELPATIQEELQAMKNNAQGAQELRKSLPSCINLQSYISQLKKHPGTLQHTKNAYSLQDMEGLTDRLQALGAYQAAQDLHLDTGSCTYQKLEQLRDLFRSSTNAYFTADRGTLPGYIDKLTLAESKKFWPKDLYSWKNKDDIYVGTIMEMNGRKEIVSNNTTGKKVRCTITNGSLQPMKLKLSKKQLENMGLVRLDMQKGVKLPVELLNTVASYRQSGCPVLLKAYLYGTLIEMMEHYPEPLAAGIAFSPLLQKDIEKYRAMARRHPVQEGCWIYNHSEAEEDDWNTFFTRVEGHNYRAEILANINSILNARLEFAGYVDADGKSKVLSFAKGKQLFYMPDASSGLTKYKAGAAAVYAPLFIVEKEKN